MKAYLELDIGLAGGSDHERDLATALLAAFGFEGFREEEGRILAYIRSGSYDPDSLKSFLKSPGLRDLIRSLRQSVIPETNWNALWEKEYPAVEIGDKCLVRAPFHPPRDGILYDLVISPKMSFGTAHHETTRLMIEVILELRWTGKRVLDFGSGTGVLSILAEKMGAAEVVALDKDPLAFGNSRENLDLNASRRIRTVLGEPGSLEEDPFDVILGNISLNVLIAEMGNLSTRMVKGGSAILSGFFRNDLAVLNEVAAGHGLMPGRTRSLNRWTVAVYRKGD